MELSSASTFRKPNITYDQSTGEMTIKFQPPENDDQMEMLNNFAYMVRKAMSYDLNLTPRAVHLNYSIRPCQVHRTIALLRNCGFDLMGSPLPAAVTGRGPHSTSELTKDLRRFFSERLAASAAPVNPSASAAPSGVGSIADLMKRVSLEGGQRNQQSNQQSNNM